MSLEKYGSPERTCMMDFCPIANDNGHKKLSVVLTAIFLAGESSGVGLLALPYALMGKFKNV